MTLTVTSPLPVNIINQNPDEYMYRIISKVTKTDSCWLWNGDSTKHGYGIIVINGMKCRVTRVMWLLDQMIDPYPLYVLHTCDTPRCVNPAHLFLGDNSTNMEDKQNKLRTPIGVNRSNSKLTDEVVRLIRIDLNTYSQSSISKFYNISQAIVSDIKTGKRWKHVI